MYVALILPFAVVVDRLVLEPQQSCPHHKRAQDQNPVFAVHDLLVYLRARQGQRPRRLSDRDGFRALRPLRYREERQGCNGK